MHTSSLYNNVTLTYPFLLNYYRGALPLNVYVWMCPTCWNTRSLWVQAQKLKEPGPLFRKSKWEAKRLHKDTHNYYKKNAKTTNTGVVCAAFFIMSVLLLVQGPLSYLCPGPRLVMTHLLSHVLVNTISDFNTAVNIVFFFNRDHSCSLN